ncbi:MAG: ABC transporter permease [Lachnospiraceae bacterium]|jgi:cell division transport system permease protein|nr:ABC transporter permease [Lachnospiraceae bacterium]MCI9589792.1 ABC transporter permease [Lachnospiraceae bacterium]
MISSFGYSLKQGFKNIGRNMLFSLASIATIAACIFLFCLFYAIVGNVRHSTMAAETTVGITVFFDQGLDETQIQAMGQEIGAREGVDSIRYISPEEAWESFQVEYFGEMKELAAGFAEDNPLANSASYEIFLTDISRQESFVADLNSMKGVRKVNYSHSAVAALENLDRIVSLLSAGIIGVLLAVAVFLISNTISVAAAFRKQENQIMRLIGATNWMIRAPFLVEGIVIGLIGAALPLAGIFVLYQRAVEYIEEHYAIMTGIFSPMSIDVMFPSMVAVALSLGVGIGFFASFFTIRKHLKV